MIITFLAALSLFSGVPEEVLGVRVFFPPPLFLSLPSSVLLEDTIRPSLLFCMRSPVHLPPPFFPRVGQHPSSVSGKNISLSLDAGPSSAGSGFQPFSPPLTFPLDAGPLTPSQEALAQHLSEVVLRSLLFLRNRSVWSFPL